MADSWILTSSAHIMTTDELYAPGLPTLVENFIADQFFGGCRFKGSLVTIRQVGSAYCSQLQLTFTLSESPLMKFFGRQLK